MSNEQSSHSEVVDYVLRALRQSAQPLAITKLKKAIPKALKPKSELPELLRQMVKAGQIRSHEARSSVYWLPSLEEQASEKIIEALTEIPLTQTDLKNKLRSLLVGWPQTKRDEMLARLLKEKRVYKVPPLTGKADLLSARAEPTTQDYIRLALQLAVARLKPRGLTAEQVMTAAREVLKPAPAAVSSPLHNVADLEKMILERMRRLNPSVVTGAPVQLSHLRHSLRSEIADKDIFDQAIMRLAEQGLVAVLGQDYVGDLSQEELAALVSDGRGNYFTSVTMRA
jgi:hypothetical protein